MGFRTFEEAGEEADRRVRKLMFEENSDDYQGLLERVFKEDPELKATYCLPPGVVRTYGDNMGDLLDQFLGPIAGKARTEPPSAGRKQTPPLRRNKSIGGVASEVDRKVQERMKATGSEDYSKTLHEVLAADPELRQRYDRGE